MLNSTDRISLASVPIPVARGVYSERLVPSGERVYYAVTSTGALLNGELRRRLSEESEAMIVRDMWRDLDRQDTVPTHPRLSLCR